MMRSPESLFTANVLTLRCSRCTRVRRFPVSGGLAGAGNARDEAEGCGWIERDGLTVCPACPQTGAERALRGEGMHA